MIYLLLFLAATAIFLYVASRWLRGELRELRAWLGEKWVVLRGGENQTSLIAAARRAFDAEGLQLEFLVVARHVVPPYEQLRRHRRNRTPSEPLPAAVVLALAADTDARRLYLRAVAPGSDSDTRDTAGFVDFGDVRGIELVPRTVPEHLAPAATQAVALDLGDDRPVHHLHMETAWNLSPEELTRRIRALVAGEWRPEAPPTIVR